MLLLLVVLIAILYSHSSFCGYNFMENCLFYYYTCYMALCRYAKHLVLRSSLDANAYLELLNLIVFFLKLNLIIFFAKQFIQMRVTIVKSTRISSFIIF